MFNFNPQVSQRLAQHLKSLVHPGKPLLLTNIHDPPSTTLALAHPKTKALATASFAIAAQAGLPDSALDATTNLAAITRIRARMLEEGKADTVPLTADLQGGYGAELERVVRDALEVGVVGCNLEDSAVGENGEMVLVGVEDQVSRIKRVLDVAAELGVRDFVVNARCDVVMLGGTVAEAVERGRAYLKAGATTVFVWGGMQRGLRDGEIRELVEGLEGRLNVIYRSSIEDALSIRQLGEMGVARISMGPGLWREGMAGIERALEKVLEGVE